ncbi:class I SAM-dependent methyltransferase [Rhodohalobacter halophilus]|uniref:class I SAM-dependent methyltransferase n=1 Tax=Rhodohalobacter halophilus TaxID=1812810 RepID=UPI00083F5A21|nr:class I SAM-dependent methyltransferase [Rhodohalobacter halophilus]
MNKNKPKKPWPTKDAMAQIYEKNLWGEGQSGFYSGIGSHHPELVVPYVDAVSSFLSSFDPPLVICDLGCGDFNIGKELVKYSKKYMAVDIVEELIDHNRETFKEENLEFYCLDIATDELPKGDCVILRQVLQHLSNQEIKKVAEKLSAFEYVILTEHLPEGDFIPNLDIISGQGIRLKKQSGLDLLARPFNLKVKGEGRLLSQPAKESKGVIVTTLYMMY